MYYQNFPEECFIMGLNGLWSKDYK